MTVSTYKPGWNQTQEDREGILQGAVGASAHSCTLPFPREQTGEGKKRKTRRRRRRKGDGKERAAEKGGRGEERNSFLRAPNLPVNAAQLIKEPEGRLGQCLCRPYSGDTELGETTGSKHGSIQTETPCTF